MEREGTGTVSFFGGRGWGFSIFVSSGCRWWSLVLTVGRRFWWVGGDTGLTVGKGDVWKVESEG